MYDHDLHKSRWIHLLTYCLPTELYVILRSTVMHHIVVWFIMRQMKHHPGHCIALYASAKKALRENLKMGKD